MQHHAQLQLRMAEWLASFGREFGKRLCEEHADNADPEDVTVGIVISDQTVLTIDTVAAHMAAAAYGVYIAMAAAVDCPAE